MNRKYSLHVLFVYRSVWYTDVERAGCLTDSIVR